MYQTLKALPSCLLRQSKTFHNPFVIPGKQFCRRVGTTKDLDKIYQALHDHPYQVYPFLASSKNTSLITNLFANNASGIHPELVNTILQPGTGTRGNITQQCLESFEKWNDHTKFAIGFLLYLNENLDSDEYVTEMVRYISTRLNISQPHDLVTLSVMFHLRKAWALTDLNKVVNLTEYQSTLSNLLQRNQFNGAELCAICLGLESFRDAFTLDDDLRLSLYEALFNIGMSGLDLTVVDELSVQLLTSYLGKGNAINRDNKSVIKSALESFVLKMDSITMETAALLTTYGDPVSLEVPELTSKMGHRLRQGETFTCLQDIRKVLSFLLRTQTDISVYQSVCQSLTNYPDERIGLKDLSDFLAILNLLAMGQVINEELCSKIFSAVNEIEDKYCSQDLLILGVEVTSNVFKTLFPKSFSLGFRVTELKHEEKVLKDILKSIASLSANISIELPNFPTANQLSYVRLNEMLPLISEQPHPARLVSLKSSVDNILGGAAFSSIVHILPQFSEPCLVFGHVAGIPLVIPEELQRVDGIQSYKQFRRAPDVGDWIVLLPHANAPLQQDGVHLLPSRDSVIQKRQLIKLGFRVVDPSQHNYQARTSRVLEQQDHVTFSSVEMLVMSILSGFDSEIK